MALAYVDPYFVRPLPPPPAAEAGWDRPDGCALIDPDAVRAGARSERPYPHLIGGGFLRPHKIAALNAQFPAIDRPGFTTIPSTQMGPLFAQLVNELKSAALAEAMSAALGEDLGDLTRVVSVMRWAQPRHGRIETGSDLKVAVLMVFMNEAWPPGAAGRERVLADPKDLACMAAEIPPTMGEVFGFLRTDASWHGFAPYRGERRVVQVSWLRRDTVIHRKRRRRGVLLRL